MNIKNLIKKIAGHVVVFKTLNMLRKNQIIVLAYHDLCSDDETIDSWLRVSVTDFRTQLINLKKLGEFISPQNSQELFKKKTIHPRFLLTFDDGYFNNYKIAFPVLKELNIPALFFISTHHLESQEMFWFDRIISPIQYHHLEKIDLSEFGLHHFYFPVGARVERWDTINKLLDDIKKIGNEQHARVKEILAYFDTRYGQNNKKWHEKFRPLKKEEIREMEQSGLCYFGSHSHFHQILTYLDEQDIYHNLETSKKILENICHNAVEHIAYPNGNFDQKVVQACHKAGFNHGFNLQKGCWNAGTDLMLIPRQMIGGYDSFSTILYQLNKSILKHG
jgi:peptidoglycan/xylan/chitin deacetylase (PgdA/CDA1 family)